MNSGREVELRPEFGQGVESVEDLTSDEIAHVRRIMGGTPLDICAALLAHFEERHSSATLGQPYTVTDRDRVAVAAHFVETARELLKGTAHRVAEVFSSTTIHTLRERLTERTNELAAARSERDALRSTIAHVRNLCSARSEEGTAAAVHRVAGERTELRIRLAEGHAPTTGGGVRAWDASTGAEVGS